MWDLIVSVPDHCLSFYFSLLDVSPQRPTLVVLHLVDISSPLTFRYTTFHLRTISLYFWRGRGPSTPVFLSASCFAFTTAYSFSS